MDGDPVGKGRPRFTKGGRAYTPKRTKDYEARVRKAYIESNGPYFGKQPVSVCITMHFQIPKSVSKKKRAAMIGAPCLKRPDVSNCWKAIEDGCNGVAFEDDAQIAEIHASKMWSEEGCAVIEIESLSE